MLLLVLLAAKRTNTDQPPPPRTANPMCLGREALAVARQLMLPERECRLFGDVHRGQSSVVRGKSVVTTGQDVGPTSATGAEDLRTDLLHAGSSLDLDVPPTFSHDTVAASMAIKSAAAAGAVSSSSPSSSSSPTSSLSDSKSTLSTAESNDGEKEVGHAVDVSTNGSGRLAAFCAILRDLCSGPDRHAFTVVMMLAAFNQLMASSAVIDYAPTLLESLQVG